MPYVWYIGNANKRELRGPEWPGGLVQWNLKNGYSVPQDTFTQAQLDILDADREFLLNQVEEVRTLPKDPDPIYGDNQAEYWYARTRQLHAEIVEGLETGVFKGEKGDKGDTGRGFRPRGNWAASTAYAVDDIVQQSGETWRTTTAHTSGATWSSTNWERWAQRGATGQGYTFKGPWAASTAYALYQVVTYQGQAYQVTTAHTSTSTFDATKFSLLAAKGDKGDKGDQGIQGIQGIQGVKGDKGDKGDNASVNIAVKNGADPPSAYPLGISLMSVGQEPNWPVTFATVETVRFGVNRSYQTIVERTTGRTLRRTPLGDDGGWNPWVEWGLKGDKGDQGIQGIQGVKGDKGEKGDKGDQGPQGLKGDKGDQGDQGIQGVKGDRGEQGIQGIQGAKGDKGDPGEVSLAQLTAGLAAKLDKRVGANQAYINGSDGQPSGQNFTSAATNYTLAFRNSGATFHVGEPTEATNPATKSYVDSRVAEVVDSAPATLDTLNELAAALGDDPNFATTVATNIGNLGAQVDTKVPKTSVPFSVYATDGNGEQTTAQWGFEPDPISVAVRDENGRITAAAPATDGHLTTKKYVDDKIRVGPLPDVSQGVPGVLYLVP